jgi:hypothetical protein
VNGSLTVDAYRTPVLSREVERVLCILVVAAAIKMPLGIPLYLNGVLLAVGLFAFVVLQALPRLFLWMIALLALGAVTAVLRDILFDSGPRLGQVVLLVGASALVARLDPALFARYLAVLPFLMILVGTVESLLPEPLYERPISPGVFAPRHGGLAGEPNYTAMLYGVVGLILAQHRPRVLAVLCFFLAIPALSRGLLFALAAWLGASALGRWLVRLAPLLVVLLCLQPLIMLWFDAAIDDALRDELNRLSSKRYLIWVAHAEAGASTPLGVGYFQGEVVATQFADLPAHHAARQAHSIFLQVWGEFGWLGYLLFVGFLLHLTRTVAHEAPAQLPLLIFILSGYAFLNGLSDWAFWVGIGYILAQARRAAPSAAAG